MPVPALLWTTIPDPMHQRAIPPDFNTGVTEREHVVGLSTRDAVVFAADCLNRGGLVVPVDAYEMVAQHARTAACARHRPNKRR